jgi:hypothetical protein
MQKIKGYKDLDPVQIELINEIKDMGIEVKKLVDALREKSHQVDQRWISIGSTDLQKGFMALTRAVAKPDFF